MRSGRNVVSSENIPAGTRAREYSVNEIAGTEEEEGQGRSGCAVKIKAPDLEGGGGAKGRIGSEFHVEDSHLPITSSAA